MRAAKVAETAEHVAAAEAVVRERAEVLAAARQRLTEWEGKHRWATDEVERLQAQIGEAVLEAPERAEELTRDLAGLRDQATVSQAAADAQRVKLPPLELAYLVALADLAEQRDVVLARAAYDAHAAVTLDLVAQLEQHEGVQGSFVPAQPERAADAASTGSFSYPAAKSAVLRQALATAETQVLVIRELAAGRDPEPLFNEWNAFTHTLDYPPAVWGPEALVPARQYLMSVERAYADVEDAERALAALPGAYDKLVDEMRRTARDNVPSRETWMGWREENLRGRVDAARARLKALGQPVAGI